MYLMSAYVHKVYIKSYLTLSGPGPSECSEPCPTTSVRAPVIWPLNLAFLTAPIRHRYSCVIVSIWICPHTYQFRCSSFLLIFNVKETCNSEMISYLRKIVRTVPAAFPLTGTTLPLGAPRSRMLQGDFFPQTRAFSVQPQRHIEIRTLTPGHCHHLTHRHPRSAGGRFPGMCWMDVGSDPGLVVTSHQSPSPRTAPQSFLDIRDLDASKG